MVECRITRSCINNKMFMYINNSLLSEYIDEQYFRSHIYPSFSDRVASNAHQIDTVSTTLAIR